MQCKQLGWSIVWWLIQYCHVFVRTISNVLKWYFESGITVHYWSTMLYLSISQSNSISSLNSLHFNNKHFMFYPIIDFFSHSPIYSRPILYILKSNMPYFLKFFSLKDFPFFLIISYSDVCKQLTIIILY